MTRPDVLGRLLQTVCNVFESYSAVLFLPAGQEGACRLTASFSLGDGVRQGMELAPGQGLAGWIVRERKPLLISNFDQKRGVLGYYSGNAEAEIKAFVGVPLPGGGGALCIDSKKVHGFGDKDMRLLADFAAMAETLHQERARLAGDEAAGQLSQAMAGLSSLPWRSPKWRDYLTELLALASTSTGFTHCFLAVRDDHACAFVLEGTSQPLTANSRQPQGGYPLGGGMIGWVFKNDQPVYSQEADTTSVRLFGAAGAASAFRTVICQPVRFSRRTRAVLVLARPDEVPIGEPLKDFARTLAGQLSLFLENLHLKSQLARRKA